MTTPIKTALELIDDIEAGKPLDPAVVKAVLWQFIHALWRL